MYSALIVALTAINLQTYLSAYVEDASSNLCAQVP